MSKNDQERQTERDDSSEGKGPLARPLFSSRQNQVDSSRREKGRRCQEIEKHRMGRKIVRLFEAMYT